VDVAQDHVAAGVAAGVSVVGAAGTHVHQHGAGPHGIRRDEMRPTNRALLRVSDTDRETTRERAHDEDVGGATQGDAVLLRGQYVGDGEVPHAACTQQRVQWVADK
jgi:hypothetical protein